MFDIGWMELFVIAAVALVVIGPKDLPKAMKTLGQIAGKARRAVQDVRSGVERLAYEAEIAESQSKTASGHARATTKPPVPPSADA